MTTLDFLAQLKSLGIDLWVEEGDRLKFRVKRKEAFTPALKAELKARKAEVIQILGRAKAVTGGETEIQIPRFDRAQEPPLSFAQERLWFIHTLEPESTAYNMPFPLRLKGDLHRQALEAALYGVIERHEALRTVFPQREGQPHQVIQAADSIPLHHVDLSDTPAAARETALLNLVEADAAAPFDLAQGPLLRMTLVRLDRDDHALLLTFHHIINDGWSSDIFFGEFVTLYQAAVDGRPPVLPPLTIQYADFAAWQRRHLSGERLEAQLAFWEKTLADAPPLLELPLDLPRPANRTFNGAVVSFQVPAATAARLNTLTQAAGATPFMTLLAAWQTLLAACAQQDDILVGVPIANRTHRLIEPLIGFFVNTLVMRNQVHFNQSFNHLLAAAKQTALDAFAHQDVPFEQIINRIKPHRDLSISPVFQAFFAMQTTGAAEKQGAQTQLSLDIQPMMRDHETAKFDLQLTCFESPTGLQGVITYNRDLFLKATADTLARRFLLLLDGIAAGPHLPLKTHPLMDAADMGRLQQWRTVVLDTPGATTVPRLFAAAVAKHGQAPALFSGDQSVSYAELDRRAEALARVLRALGVGPESPVAVCLPRSPEMITAFLAVGKAGGAYIPLDPNYPPARIAYILEDAAARILISHTQLDINWPLVTTSPDTGRPLDLDRLWIDQPPPSLLAVSDAPLPGPDPQNLAYIIYTSGSTGRPKGVAVPQHCLANHTFAVRENYQLTPDDRVLQFCSISFDMSAKEIYPTLTAGATLVLHDQHKGLTTQQVLDLVTQHGITHLAFPASYFHNWVQDLEEQNLSLPPSLRLVNSGGEKAGSELLEAFETRTNKALTWINTYGPTETTVIAAWYTRRGGCDNGLVPANVPIGIPVGNFKLYILDEDLRLTPPGLPGKLYIGGAGVSRGYYQRPDLTAAVFLPNPFGQNGDRFYASGDVVRYDHHGRILFVGRADHQVKVRGFRIETGEIESALLNHPAIARALVVTRPDAAGRHMLVAYMTPAADAQIPDQGELQTFARRFLPEYMIPAYLMPLETFPLTPNGKINRAALPEPQWGVDADNAEPPQTPSEIAVADIFSQVLNLELHDRRGDFFQLGGHSLLATRVIARLKTRTGVDLPLRVLFEHPTVADLAAFCDGLTQADTTDTPITPRPPGLTDLPLSFSQERMWFLYQLEPQSPAYNMPTAMHLTGDLDLTVLTKAFAHLTARHEALRTCFGMVDQHPGQIIHPRLDVHIPLLDLSAAADPAATARRLLTQEINQPFVLEQAPLWRLQCYRLAPKEHVFLINMHHIIGDGWSYGILLRELMKAYSDLTSGAAPDTGPAPLQYPDVAVWQRREYGGEMLDTQLAFWENLLQDGSDALDLPLDFPRPALATNTGADLTFELDAATAAMVTHFSRRNQVTPFITLLTVFGVLLSRYAGQRDLNIGTVVANRGRTELEGVVGLFVNTLTLRLQLEDGLTFADLVDRVKAMVLGCFANEQVPFEKVVERLQPERNTSRTPLFQVMYSHGAREGEATSNLTPNLSAGAWELGVQTAKFELSLDTTLFEDRLLANFQYNADLFSAQTITAMSRHFQTLAHGLLSQPQYQVDDVSLLDDDARRQLARFNGSCRPFPAGSPLELITTAAQRNGDATALYFKDQHLTYAQLEERTNRFAHHLRQRGLNPEDTVAVVTSRGPNMIIAILGVLKAGGVYMPLDPNLPQSRQQAVLQSAGARLVVLPEPRDPGLPPNVDILDMDQTAPAVAACPSSPRPGVLSPLQAAYILFTSGSTGTPKGVCVTHGSLANHNQALIQYCDLTPRDRVLQFASLSFDISIEEIFATLSAGAALVLHGQAQGLAPMEVEALVEQYGVTLLDLPTAFWHAWVTDLAASGRNVPPSLRLLIVGGEKAKADLLQTWLRLCPPGARWLNTYGPTEGTIIASWYTVERGAQPPDTVAQPPIGTPLPNVTTHLLDRRFQPVPIGLPGALYLGGKAPARGYVGRPDLTAEVFVPDPFSAQPGARLYATGDSARFRADGNLDFLGRIDTQIKIRGFRIETGEVEAVLARHQDVRQVVVFCRTGSNGRAYLLACIVPASQAPTVADMDRHARQHMPEYMAPAAYVFMDQIPLTATGKFNWRAVPSAEERLDDIQYTAPRDPVEAAVCDTFAQVLDRQKVGVHDNFFHLGGHSLLATQVISRLKAQLDRQIPLKTLFECPTPAELAAHLAHHTDHHAALPPLIPQHLEGPLPLSFAQERLWFIDRLEPESTKYTISFAFKLLGNLNRTAFIDALKAIIQRHQVLRTIFGDKDGEPYQTVLDVTSVPIQVEDLTAQPNAEEQFQQTAVAEAAKPFSLYQPPLCRIRLLCYAPHRHGFLLNIHHAAFDGWSSDVFFAELGRLYQAFSTGAPSPLQPLPVQYADFAVWQRSWLQGERLNAQLDYWSQNLAGAATLNLPFDQTPPPVMTHHGDSVPVTMDDDLRRRFNQHAKSRGATLFMTLLAVYKTLLQRYCLQEDIAVGTPIANRNHAELEPLIGFFVNTLVLRDQINPQQSFNQLLDRVRTTALNAYAHQDVPFELVIDRVNPTRDLSHSPLFQSFFALQTSGRHDTGDSPTAAMADIQIEAPPMERGVAKFELQLSLMETPDGLSGALIYNTDLFLPQTIQLMAQRLVRLCHAVLAAPNTPLAQLDMMTPEDRRRLAAGYTTRLPVPQNVSVDSLIDAAAQRSPNAAALIYGRDTLTYQDLEHQSNRLAHHLTALGVGPDSPVGVCVPRSPAMIISFLAVLKAGGAYIPLDPAYPPERIAYILEDADTPLLLLGPDVNLETRDDGPRTLRLDDAFFQDLTRRPHTRPPIRNTPENLAYIIYTSGSTGKPKGVAVPHHCLVNHIHAVMENYRLTPEDRVLQFCSISFDMSAKEIYPALCAGAGLVLHDQHKGLATTQVLELVEVHRISILAVPASYFHNWVNDLIQQNMTLPPVLRLVNSGGEKAKTPVLRAFEAMAGPAMTWINTYGPTETTVIAAWYTRRGNTDKGPIPDNVPIGLAVANFQLHILDPALHPVPPGLPGELYIGGAGVSRGYLKRPAMTAERFVPNPFGQSGSRLYASGDVVRALPDGNIIFMGRADHQVKVRGFRIETGEIEAALVQHPAIAQAVVIARPDAHGQNVLIAYLVPRQSAADIPDAEQLYPFARRFLPDYMIPGHFVTLTTLPTTPNGKTDLARLPQPDLSAGRGEHVAPRTPLETTVARIFAQILGQDQVGVHDDFFRLGGHSLLATRVISRLKTALSLDLPLRTLFEHTTVAALADHIQQETFTAEAAPPLTPHPHQGPIPLSFAQERLWFIDRLEPGTNTYNIPVALRFKGGLCTQTLARALRTIIARHQALRTVFHAQDDQPRQVILPEDQVPVHILDYSQDPPRLRQERLQTLIQEDAQRPFHLDTGPNARFHLVVLDSDEHALILNFHHIVYDGWSSDVFFSELGRLCDAYHHNRPNPLPPLEVQYPDFAVWQRQWLQGDALERQLAYWDTRLSGAPARLNLPLDKIPPPTMTYHADVAPVQLSPTVRDQLDHLGQTHGATRFMTLLAAFNALLFHYSGQDDVVVGSPIANRNHTRIEPLIGFFVNTLALRNHIDGQAPFTQLLETVKQTAVEAYAHQDVPFELVIDRVNPDRDLSHSPLFQTFFLMQSATAVDPAGGSGLEGVTVEPIGADNPVAKFELQLTLVDTPDGISGTLIYNTDLFLPRTAQTMVRHYQNLVADLAAHPQRAVMDLNMMDQDQRNHIIHAFNQTHLDQPKPRALHQWFEAKAAQTPQAEALIFRDERLTYAQLNARANHLAHRLQAMGIGPERVVGLYCNRSTQLIIAMLAALKAGGCYLPLDPAYPADRLAFMLDDARAAVVITPPQLQPSLPPSKAQTLIIDEETTPAAPADAPPVSVLADNPAYLIYTSGSTGRPKGVVITHANADALIHWSHTLYPPQAFRRVLFSTSINFDLSIFELFVTLSAGGCVCLVENVLDLVNPAQEPDITLINTVPSAIRQLVENNAVPPSTRYINLAGEPLKNRLVQQLYRETNVDQIYNLYGPSEDTTYSTWLLTQRNAPGEPGIGVPIANTRIYILDRKLRPTPLGVPGEICISGAGLARGYLARPDMTAEKFIPNPLAQSPGDSRLYRTGDLGRYLPNGEILFLGRLDFQVKIRGFRIEIGEIESLLLSHADVADTVIVAREDHHKQLGLVAYVAGPNVPNHDQLAAWLGRTLPEYMVPGRFVTLDALPLTPNGKVDRKALPEPAAAAVDAAYAAPRNPLETAVTQIFADILGLERVGITDDFFKLGGHSLLATRVVSQIKHQLKIQLPLKAVFQNTTAAALAAQIQRSETEGAGDQPLVKQPRPEHPPLSFAQERLWFIDRLEPGQATYNIPIAVRFKGALDTACLHRALQTLVQRHESLRTVFLQHHQTPYQHIQAADAVPVVLEDCTAMTVEARDQTLTHAVNANARQPFDLSAGPLARLKLMVLASDDHALLLCFHHIIFDGWSSDVFFAELGRLYAAYHQGLPNPLPPLKLHYADFAVWQRQRLSGELLEQQLAYWEQHLSGAPPLLNLPLDKTPPPVMTYHGAEERLSLDAATRDRLNRISQEAGATLFMTLLTAFKTLLLHYTGSGDLPVGMPIANRNHHDIEPLIGFFVNTLVPRDQLDAQAPFTQALAQVKETALGAFSHQDVPFERVIERLNPQRDLSHSPLFQAFFVMQTAMTQADADTGGFPGVTAQSLTDTSTTAKFELQLTLQETRDGIQGSLTYNTDLFLPETAHAMVSHFQNLATHISQNPHLPLIDLNLMDEAERQRVTHTFNQTDQPLSPSRLLHQWFEQSVQNHPQRTALQYLDLTLTYAQLNQRANHLAHKLKAHGVGPESVVGLFHGRTPDLVIAMLATLKAGGCYLPLDPAYPADRLAFMLEDTAAAVVITQPDLMDQLPPTTAARLIPEPPAEDAPKAALQPTHTTPQNTAYLIYTSGSTGRPKGVVITHANAGALITWSQTVFTPADFESVLFSTSINFDLSIFELFVTLAHGGAVLLVQNALDLTTLPAQTPISLINTVPSAARQLLEADALPAAARVINLAGEPLKNRLVQQLFQKTNVQHVYNLYGPSEDTTYSTWLRTQPGAEVEPTIGVPIGNTKVYILDAKLRPTALGVPGEICIAGSGLARGYLARPDLTAEKFLPNPLAAQAGDRLYRTGDLGRYQADGQIRFLGRLDFQVKIRGFRIEMGEIESLLLKHDAVDDALVLAKTDPQNQTYLAAYIAGPNLPAEADLKTWLGQFLPEYMVPARLILLPQLPLTPNGKVDRKALPEPQTPTADQALVPPQTPAEVLLAQIWCELLGLTTVSTADHFFTLGGHSLLLLSLANAVRARTGLNIALPTLFQAPVLADMARLLTQDPTADDVVIPLAQGPGPAWFIVHPVGGQVHWYTHLAQLLEAPVYGIQSPGLSAPLPAHWTLNDLAADYVQRLKEQQPAGPYNLAGWSVGGSIAFEMARLLEAQGQTVRLVLIDALNFGAREQGADTTRMLDNFAAELAAPHGIDADALVAQSRREAPDNPLDALLDGLAKAGVLAGNENRRGFKNLFHLYQTHWRLVYDYRPQPLTGPVLSLQARDTRDHAADPGWSGFSTQITHAELDGNHYTIFTPPRVQALAQRMLDWDPTPVAQTQRKATMDNKPVYLKQSIILEPLVNQWYGWGLLISPHTLAMIVSNLHVKILESYIKAPQIHANAVRNPKMIGGPFMDLPGDQRAVVKDLLERTKTRMADLLTMAEDIKALDKMIMAEARGNSLIDLYPRIPESLKGFVELGYDLNNQPSMRFIEGMLYQSKYFNRDFQQILLTQVKQDERSFALSTPRFPGENNVILDLHYGHEGISRLFSMKDTPQPLSHIEDLLPQDAAGRNLMQDWFTEQAPQQRGRDRAELGDQVRVKYFGHATILIESRDISIMTDPIVAYDIQQETAPRYTYEDLPEVIDYVVITHNHQDHLMYETLLQLKHRIKTIVVPRSNGGTLQDPSMRWILKYSGFENVIELDEMEEIPLPDGRILGLPFFGEHGELHIRSKLAFCIQLKGKSIMCAADSNNLEPRLYDFLRQMVGKVDTLFLGMECAGAPMSWLYGPLLTKPLERRFDQTRRLDGSDYERGMKIIESLGCDAVYVYAMGQEPWLTFVSSIKYTETSKPIVESNKLVEACRAKGLTAERLFGCKAVTLP